MEAAWTGALPSHSPGIPKLADRVAQGLYAQIAAGKINRLDAIYSRWQPGQGTRIERKHLLPFEMDAFAAPKSGSSSTNANPPMLYLPPGDVAGADRGLHDGRTLPRGAAWIRGGERGADGGDGGGARPDRAAIGRAAGGPAAGAADAVYRREGQGPRPWTKLGPSRLGRAAHDGPRPHFICSETSIGSEPVGRIHGTARMVQKTPAAQR